MIMGIKVLKKKTCNITAIVSARFIDIQIERERNNFFRYSCPAVISYTYNVFIILLFFFFVRHYFADAPLPCSEHNIHVYG